MSSKHQTVEKANRFRHPYVHGGREPIKDHELIHPSRSNSKSFRVLVKGHITDREKAELLVVPNFPSGKP